MQAMIPSPMSILFSLGLNSLDVGRRVVSRWSAYVQRISCFEVRKRRFPLKVLRLEELLYSAQLGMFFCSPFL